ncbi:MAG: insulinase family protein [Muribaculaceae bacterium]|nr:insulinase family protein [Muribaculaceae bacterium]
MKKLLFGALALMASLFMPTPVSGQQLPPLPTDSAVVSGVLPNGLTYYIRHNEYPKGQADFHIAQKVGSILEEDNQRGLAHFLEHMCFNGTKNFPGNSLISYLESIGVKFGSHLNAYTGTDETVYKITNVPTARTEVTDSVLLILHDWADALLLDPEEIDKERGVIHEEWRTGQGGQMRILEKVLPEIYPGSKYAHRLPIGTMEVVDNFPYQALRDYYEAWYRPDQQGIVVVGDIDVARTEQVIKKMFGDITMPENAPMRLEFDVPDTPGTIYALGADKEQSNAIVYLIFKHGALPKYMRNTQAQLVTGYIEQMIDAMLNARFDEMMSDPSTPFGFAQATIGDYMMSNTKNMFAVIGGAKDGDIAKTLVSIYREVLRAKRGGFTQSEYDRARAEYLAGLERAYNNRDSRENGVYTQEVIRHFIDGDPMLGIEMRYELMSQIANMLPIEVINQTFSQFVTDANRVVLCMLPDDVYMPTKDDLARMMAAVDAETIEVFTDNVRQDPLIPVEPKAGSVVATYTEPAWPGIEVWTLSNGATVYLKKTDFKADEIILAASAPGGMSQVYASCSPANALCLQNIWESLFGIGAYNSNDLQKYLAGKKVGINPNFSLYETTISGSSTPKDLPALMELLYGYFTSVSYPETEFSASQSLYSGMLENQEKDPRSVFGKVLYQGMYASPYQQQITAADIKAATAAGIEEIARSRVADASQWAFTFVGNFDTDQLRTLCEKYLASLPSTKSGRKLVGEADSRYMIKAGEATEVFTTPMETPQTYCAIVESATMPYNSINAKLSSITGQILSARLLKNIREEMGAVYSIGASGDISSAIGRNAELMTSFPMNPEKKQQVLDAIKNEFAAMAEEITAEELGKVKEFLVKSYAERAQQNSAWAGYIDNWTLTGSDNFSNAIEEVNSISPEAVKNFVKEMNAQGNYRVVILDPQP